MLLVELFESTCTILSVVLRDVKLRTRFLLIVVRQVQALKQIVESIQLWVEVTKTIRNLPIHLLSYLDLKDIQRNNIGVFMQKRSISAKPASVTVLDEVIICLYR